MLTTNDGNLVIHKNVWDKIKHDDHYRELAEEIEDLEDHYLSKIEGGEKSFKEFLSEKA
jgi:ribosome recycling factor